MGTYVCEYRGDLIGYKEALRREEHYNRTKQGCYMFFFSQGSTRMWYVLNPDDCVLAAGCHSRARWRLGCACGWACFDWCKRCVCSLLCACCVRTFFRRTLLAYTAQPLCVDRRPPSPSPVLLLLLFPVLTPPEKTQTLGLDAC